MKPILFSTPMVQAILDGRKTMTRLVIKKIPRILYEYNNLVFYPFRKDKKFTLWTTKNDIDALDGVALKSPYKVGDILWARETWTYGRVVGESDEYGNSEFWLEQTQKEKDEKCIFYKADMDDAVREDISFKDVFWKPSIFMPKKYARIFLRVTNVRVERLQDISEEDCLAEGIYEFDDNDCTGDYKAYTISKPNIHYGICIDDKFNSAYEAFEWLWNSINGKGAWESNPYVFVYTFQRVDNENGC